MDYARTIVALYEGEVYGEHLFTALANREDDSQVAGMWQAVADVERLTRARIRPLAARFERDLDRQDQLGEARAAAQLDAFAGQSWREVLAYYRPRVPANVARLRELEVRAPAGDEEVIGHFIAHSEAFGQCIEHMLADDRSGAMQALQAYLSG